MRATFSACTVTDSTSIVIVVHAAQTEALRIPKHHVGRQTQGEHKTLKQQHHLPRYPEPVAGALASAGYIADP